MAANLLTRWADMMATRKKTFMDRWSREHMGRDSNGGWIRAASKKLRSQEEVGVRTDRKQFIRPFRKQVVVG